MKKLIIIGIATGLICLIVLFLILRSGKSDELANEIWHSDFKHYTYGYDEVFHQKDYLLYCYESESKSDWLICDNPACRHIRGNCGAAFDGMVYGCVRSNDGLVMVTDEGANTISEKLLVSMTSNGMERKLIHKFENDIQIISSVLITPDYVIISYYNQYDKDYRDLDRAIAGVVFYDRKIDVEKKLFENEEWNARIGCTWSDGNKVVFAYMGWEMTRDEALENASDSAFFASRENICIIELDIHTNKSDILVKCNGYGDLYDCDRGIFYTYDDKLFFRDTAQKNDIELGHDIQNIYTAGSSGSYLQEWKEGMFHLYYFDYDTHELSSIGQLPGRIMIDCVINDRFYFTDVSDDISKNGDILSYDGLDDLKSILIQD